MYYILSLSTTATTTQRICIAPLGPKIETLVAAQEDWQTTLARLFWARCNLSKVAAGAPLNSALQ